MKHHNTGQGKVVLDETQLSHFDIGQAFAISPEGSKSAYFDARSNLSLLQTKSAETNSLVVALGDNKFLSWSPDNNKIAILNNGDLYVIDSNGGNLKQVVQHGVHNYLTFFIDPTFDDTLSTPTWLPDDQTILYNRQLH